MCRKALGAQGQGLAARPLEVLLPGRPASDRLQTGVHGTLAPLQDHQALLARSVNETPAAAAGVGGADRMNLLLQLD